MRTAEGESKQTLYEFADPDLETTEFGENTISCGFDEGDADDT